MRKILLLFAILLIASSVYAPRTIQTQVTNLVGVYNLGCATYSWATTLDAEHNVLDFNTYRVKTTSSVSALSGLDVNQTNATYQLCTIPPGGYATIEVERFDGNAEGIFQSLGVEDEIDDDAGDANYTVEPGTMPQAGQLLFFNVLAAIAGFVSLIVIITIVVVLLKKSGIDIASLFRK